MGLDSSVGIRSVFKELVDQSNGMLDLELKCGFVNSICEFREQYGPFDGIVVTTGATTGCIEELRGVLPLRLCQVRISLLKPNSFEFRELRFH